MGNSTMNQEKRHLRLVVDNADPCCPLMPILDIERRLKAIERDLRRPALAPETRVSLLAMRALLCCELEARPFNPTLARRCEHRLRWIERNLAPVRPRLPNTLLERARTVLSAILPAPTASA